MIEQLSFEDRVDRANRQIVRHVGGGFEVEHWVKSLNTALETIGKTYN